MNERIKLLADQAELTIRDSRGNTYMSHPEFNKKFAELIVQECVNQALEEKVSEEEIDKEDDIEDRCYLRGNNGGIVDAVIRIKQHFGVEE
jgi:hypothetical protein